MIPAPTVRPGADARAVLEEHGSLAERARAVLDRVDSARAGIEGLAAAGRDAKIRAELAGIGVERLGELTEKNLRLRALLDGGYRTALDVLGATPAELDLVPGVGPETARSAVAAADQLAQAVGAGAHLRLSLDPAGRVAGAELVTLLARVLRLGPLVEPHREALTDYSGSVAAALPAAAPARHRLGFALRRRRTRQAALDALSRLVGWEPWLAATGTADTVARLSVLCQEREPSPNEVWRDVERRAAAYYALLAEIVPDDDGARGARGMLAAELADRVAAYPLDTTLLRAQLRGYQEFGAQFVLNQGRALLGDEMGLGKTVQAIAAMADQAARGERHFLVVCPASVLVNWLREVPTHSVLVAHRLHGPERDEAMACWHADGGVGVTTFEGLAHVVRPGSGLGLLVVDEAHLVKNPDAQRSQEVAQWAAQTWRVVLMTGTPMENSLTEFVELARLLQPDLVADLPRHVAVAGAEVFRRTVAPVYLRRNQVDVLVELPELVAVDEWTELSEAEEAVYRAAVASGSFVAMRRAAFATPDPRACAKLERLVEIVVDAVENGHRVVVFSFFLDVLDAVCGALTPVPGVSVHGPIIGAVPADRRQEVIDEFSAAPPGAVLVAQVQAGGVGVNIQAASVVVLCEPQLTPTAEAQAVARVHRMGQLRTVVVHRLLVAGGVDERIRELLAGKRRVFDDYVRESSVAGAAVRAVDVTQARLAREVVAAEQARLGYGPVWDALESEGLLTDGGPAD